jgi:hypothetical protein
MTDRTHRNGQNLHLKKYGHDSHMTMGVSVLSSRIAMNMLNKHSRTSNEGWSSGVEDGRKAKNASPQSSWLRNVTKGTVVGSCGHDNELSGSIKCGEFLDYLGVTSS